MERRKIIVRHSLLFVCAYAALALLLYSLVNGELRNFLIKQRQRELLAYLEPARAKVAHTDFETPDKIIALFVDHLGDRFAYRRMSVLDAKGRILASTLTNLIGQAEKGPEVDHYMVAGQSGFFVDAEEKEVLNLLYVFTFDNRITGAILTAFPVYDIEDAVEQAVIKALLSAFGVLFVIFALYALRAIRGSELHAELTRAFDTLSRGNFSFAPQVKIKGSAKGVFAAFMEMVSHLRKRDDLKMSLFEKVKNIAVSRSFNTMFERLAESFKSETSADKLSVMLIKDESLVVSYVVGFSENLVFVGESYRIHEDVFTEAIEFGRPLLLEDESEIRVNARYKALLREPGRDALFPITVGNEVYGLIHVSRLHSKGPFQDIEVDAGALLAGGAGVAMLHLTENADRKALTGSDLPVTEESAESRPSFTVLSGAETIKVACAHMGPGWSEFFELPGTKGNDTLIATVTATDAILRNPVHARVTGMLAMAARLKAQTGKLAFFSLSMLMKQPPSEQRDSLLKLFTESPFSAAGVRSLLIEGLKEYEGRIRIEVVRLDSKKQIFEAATEETELLLLCDGRFETPGKARCEWKKGLLLGLPSGAFNPLELSPILNETEPTRVLHLLLSREESTPRAARSGELFAAIKTL